VGVGAAAGAAGVPLAGVRGVLVTQIRLNGRSSGSWVRVAGRVASMQISVLCERDRAAARLTSLTTCA